MEEERGRKGRETTKKTKREVQEKGKKRWGGKGKSLFRAAKQR